MANKMSQGNKKITRKILATNSKVLVWFVLAVCAFSRNCAATNYKILVHTVPAHETVHYLFLVYTAS